MAPGTNNYNGTNGSYRGDYIGDLLGSNEKQENNDPDEIDLKRVFYLLWNRKWIIAGTVAVCTLVAGIIASNVTPIYQSEASLLISQ